MFIRYLYFFIISIFSNVVGANTYFGMAGDRAVPADFDGDKRTDIAIFRIVDGYNAHWFIRSPFQQIPFGMVGDTPAPADYDGDGKADIAIFRIVDGYNARWFIRSPFQQIPFGMVGDIPVPADYNGDGKADIAVFRPSTGQWFFRSPFQSVAFGTVGDIPVPADYNGDGKMDIAVFRPTTGTWFIHSPFQQISLGQSGDMPAPGDFNGDRKAEPAVFRPSTGEWHVDRLGLAASHGAVTSASGIRPLPFDFNGDGSADFMTNVNSDLWQITPSALPSRRPDPVPNKTNAVNVVHYGANGTDSTDDTLAVVRAMQAAVEQGRDLYFPQGTYLVSNLSDRFIRGTMFGDGIGKSIIRQPKNPTAFFGESQPILVWFSIRSNTSYVDLEFAADAEINSEFHRMETKLDARNITFNRVKVSGFKYGYGLSLQDNCSDIQITNSHIEAGRWGLTIVDCKNILVEKSTIRTTGKGAALEIEPEPWASVKPYGGARNILVQDCVIDGNNGFTAVNLYGGGGSDLIGAVTLRRNKLRNAGIGIFSLSVKHFNSTENVFENSISEVLRIVSPQSPRPYYWWQNIWGDQPIVYK